MIIDKHGYRWKVVNVFDSVPNSVSVFDGEPDMTDIIETIDWSIEQHIKPVPIDADDYYYARTWSLTREDLPKFNDWGEICL